MMSCTPDMPWVVDASEWECILASASKCFVAYYTASAKVLDSLARLVRFSACSHRFGACFYRVKVVE